MCRASRRLSPGYFIGSLLHAHVHAHHLVSVTPMSPPVHVRRSVLWGSRLTEHAPEGYAQSARHAPHPAGSPQLVFLPASRSLCALPARLLAAFDLSIGPIRSRCSVQVMLSGLVALAAFAPPAAQTSSHASRPVFAPLRAAQPLCKVWDSDDKVIYVGEHNARPNNAQPPQRQPLPHTQSPRPSHREPHPATPPDSSSPMPPAASLATPPHVSAQH